MTVTAALAAVLVGAAGPAWAGHQVAWPDGASGDTTSVPFELIPEMRFTIEWAGIGGSGGDGSRFQVVYGPDGEPFLCCYPSDTIYPLSPNPDDCADVDGLFPTAYSKAPVPSVYLRPGLGSGTLVPEQSLPAGIVETLCTMLREMLVGQASGYRYASDPQSIGVGDVSYAAERTLGTTGSFDDALTALPSSLTAMLCGPGEFLGSEAKGDEEWTDLGFPNGVLLGMPADNCVDQTADYLAPLGVDRGAQWNPGAINVIGNEYVYGTVTDQFPPGFYVACLAAFVFDLNNAIVGIFEDYSYFWLDDPPYTLAPSWALPAASDSGSGDNDCDAIGIPV